MDTRLVGIPRDSKKGITGIPWIPRRESQGSLGIPRREPSIVPVAESLGTDPSEFPLFPGCFFVGGHFLFACIGFCFLWSACVFPMVSVCFCVWH